MARLYANENFPLPVVVALRAMGHDVLTVQETGKAEQQFPDNLVLAFATSEYRAVMTLNRKHFIRLHQLSAAHQGIVVCTVDPDFEGQARRIDSTLSGRPVLAGQLVRVNRPPLV